MDEEIQKYYPLGEKTLFMLILRKSTPLFLLFIGLLIGVAFLYSASDTYFDLVVEIIFIYMGALVLLSVFTFFLGWLEYHRFGIFISNKDLRIRRGLISTEEIGVPYRRIRDVKIKRSLLDQIFGVSDIIVILSDFEGEGGVSDESTVFLPSLDKNIAIEIQNTILKKSQVEQINLIGAHDNVLNRMSGNQQQKNQQ